MLCALRATYTHSAAALDAVRQLYEYELKTFRKGHPSSSFNKTRNCTLSRVFHDNTVSYQYLVCFTRDETVIIKVMLPAKVKRASAACCEDDRCACMWCCRGLCFCVFVCGLVVFVAFHPHLKPFFFLFLRF